MADDRRDEDEDERESDTGPQDLKHDNGRWYTNKFLGAIVMLLVVSCEICYKVGYNSGREEADAEKHDDRGDEVAAAEAATTPTDEREYLLTVTDTAGRDPIVLPKGEKISNVCQAKPGLAPSILTRRMRGDECAERYVFRGRDLLGGVETYLIVESGALETATAPNGCTR